MTTTMRFPQPTCPPGAPDPDTTHDDVPKQRSSTSHGIEDDILIRRITCGDPEAFTTLYQRYAPRLAGFLYPRLAQPDLVDDVLHETLLVVWQDAARFRGQAQLSTWIFCIAQRAPGFPGGYCAGGLRRALAAAGARERRDPCPGDAIAGTADHPRSLVRAGLVCTGYRGALGLLGLHGQDPTAPGAPLPGRSAGPRRAVTDPQGARGARPAR